MSRETTIVGNATADAELKYLPSGVAVCTFTVAETPRVKNGDGFVDGEAMFVRCTAWRELGEHAAEVITRGMRVMVHGRLKVSAWEKDGVKRTSLEMDVEAAGPDLRFATATVHKASRDGGVQQRPRAAAQDDPWAAPAAQQSAFDDSSAPF